MDLVRKFEDGAARLFNRPQPEIDAASYEVAILCSRCPLTRECRENLGRGYTGIAAGKIYVNGRPRTRRDERASAA